MTTTEFGQDAPLLRACGISWSCVVRVAAALAGSVLVTAIAVRAGWGAGARAWLRFPFAGLEATPGQAAAIFAANARLLVAPFAAALVAQAPHLAGSAHGDEQDTRGLRVACDAALATAVAGNVFVIGAALGAYGRRMAGAMLPHGPLELLAFSLALATYLGARRAPLAFRPAACAAGGGLLALAAAAVLETYVVL